MEEDLFKKKKIRRQIKVCSSLQSGMFSLDTLVLFSKKHIYQQNNHFNS